MKSQKIPDKKNKNIIIFTPKALYRQSYSNHNHLLFVEGGSGTVIGEIVLFIAGENMGKMVGF